MSWENRREIVEKVADELRVAGVDHQCSRTEWKYEVERALNTYAPLAEVEFTAEEWNRLRRTEKMLRYALGPADASFSFQIVKSVFASRLVLAPALSEDERRKLLGEAISVAGAVFVEVHNLVVASRGTFESALRARLLSPPKPPTPEAIKDLLLIQAPDAAQDANKFVDDVNAAMAEAYNRGLKAQQSTEAK